MKTTKTITSFKKLINEEYDEVEIGTIDYWKEKDISVYDRIIENNKEINVDFSESWYEFVYEYFIEQMDKKFGWSPDESDISFSGFWSQGDGASFEGNMDASEVAELLKNIKLPKKQRILFDLANSGSVDIDVSFDRSGRYVHEKSVSTNIEIDVNDYEETFKLIADDNQHQDFDGMTADTEYDEDEHEDIVYDYCQSIAEDYEEIIDGWRLEACGQLYKELEDAYEGLTSEESIYDTCVANEYEFDENGEIQ